MGKTLFEGFENLVYSISRVLEIVDGKTEFTPYDKIYDDERLNEISGGDGRTKVMAIEYAVRNGFIERCKTEYGYRKVAR